MASIRPAGGAARGQKFVAPSADELLNLAVGSQFSARQLSGVSQIVGPDFKGIPTSSEYGEFEDIIPLTKLINSKSILEQYDPMTGSQFENFGQEPDMEDESPAEMSVVPTSTINPERPRTVAAGYDSVEKKITVVFRDGTYYNYYQVDKNEWQAFKARVSKGRYILSYLDSKPRGPADVSSISATAQKAFYRIARASQVHLKGRPDKYGKIPKPKKP